MRRFKGANASNAAVVFTAMVVWWGVVEVAGTTHFPADQNKRAGRDDSGSVRPLLQCRDG